MKQRMNAVFKLNKPLQTLRTREVPPEIAELLSVANKLPRTLDESHDNVVNPILSMGSSTSSSVPIHNQVRTGPSVNLEALTYFLGKAIELLPAELRVFVKPDDSLLEHGAEGWRNALGPLLFDCAKGASGGLLLPKLLTASEVEERKALEARGQVSFPHEGKPFFGLGEIEAMRQRYLFLFALRELLEAISRAHISLAEARRRLDLLDLHPGFSWPSPPLAQVEVFRGRFDIGQRDRKTKTHKLGYAKPKITWVLQEIEVERIRVCPVCTRLYWAGRLDQSACRAMCSNVLRAKRWREKHGAKYKSKRRAAASSKTKVKTRKGRKGR
jgi:hypothetical protein